MEILHNVGKARKGQCDFGMRGVRMRSAPNPTDRNSSLAGSSSKRTQGMSRWPEIAETDLPLDDPPGGGPQNSHVMASKRGVFSSNKITIDN